MGKIKRVPVIMQMEMVECGAASLGMILAYFGKWLTLEQLRKDCGVSRDGSNAIQLLSAGRGYGLKGQGYKVDIDDLKDMAPAILHWEFNHFVVFKGFKGNRAYLNDPAKGNVSLSREEFSRSFTGVALHFEKGEDFVPGGRPASIKAFIRTRLKSASAVFIFTFIVSLVTAVIGLTIPFFSQIYMDNILSNNKIEWFLPFIAAFSVVIIVSFVSDCIQGIYSRRFKGAMSIDSNSKFLWHILHLPMDFFSQRYVGDLIFRQSSNQNITSTLVDKIAPAFVNVLLLALYLGFMLNYSVELTCIGLAAIFINLFVMRYIANKRVDLARVAERDEGKFYGVTMSCLQNMETIKAAGAEAGFFGHWAGHFNKMHNSSLDLNRSTRLMNIIPQILVRLVNDFVLVVGIYLILGGAFTIGMLMAFQGFMGRFLAPANELLSLGKTIIELRTQMERVEDVLKYPRDFMSDSIQSGRGKLTGELELKGVTFGYNPYLEPQIKDFSLHLKPGKSVAFVGASGCGKSTLAKLIAGLYTPWEGEILFGGRKISEISHREFVNSVAVIDQNVVLFDDTVAQNIKMWDDSIEDFSMILACKDAQIREDIISRPEGYNAKLIRGGENFSGGQRQRLEIATALAREPVILIMDEATSALDSDTEEKVMNAIKMSGVTLIIIAHRLSTIRDCDEIIMLDGGRVVERGTHTSLMEKCGRYKELMESN